MNDKESAINSGLVNTWQQKTVGYIELNRPDKANAYDDALLNDLSSALDKMEADREVRTLVITGAGNRTFCAGADLNEMKKKLNLGKKSRGKTVRFVLQ
jgi:enoyl-CoA hydratase/carnithine racemase